MPPSSPRISPPDTATASLFSGLDLVVAPGDVIGLVGANGAGKSTLLRTARRARRAGARHAAAQPADRHRRLPAAGARAAARARRCATFLARRTGVAARSAALDAATEALVDGRARRRRRATPTRLERWLALGGADLDERAEEVAADLGLGVDLDQPMTALSGGQAARAGPGLAAAVSRYDVFLLDEPTNDLDLDGLERLERFVTGLRAGTVVVSHDREFLARTVTRVRRARPRPAAGHASTAAATRPTWRSARSPAGTPARTYEEYADTRAGAARRGPACSAPGWRRASATPGARPPTTTRSAASSAPRRREKQAAKARQTERLIERLDVVEEPRKEWELRMEIAAAPRAGAVVATLRGAGGPARRLHPRPGRPADRLGRPGRDHRRQRLGQVDAARPRCSAGCRWTRARDARPRGAWSARWTRRAGCSSATSRCWTRSAPRCRHWPRRRAHPAGQVRPDAPTHVLRPAATLSPGERTRAALALLQARGVNLLVLDEPTNHLDLPAIEQLESALATYPGTLLLVTHDRRMLDAVHTTRRVTVRRWTRHAVVSTGARQPRDRGADRAPTAAGSGQLFAHGELHRTAVVHRGVELLVVEELRRIRVEEEPGAGGSSTWSPASGSGRG